MGGTLSEASQRKQGIFPMSQDIDPQVWNEIVSAIFEGQKFQAIKLYVEATDADLLEAKEVVDNLTEELRQESPEKFVETPRGSGCGAAVLVVALGLGTTLLTAHWLCY